MNLKIEGITKIKSRYIGGKNNDNYMIVIINKSNYVPKPSESHKKKKMRSQILHHCHKSANYSE